MSSSFAARLGTAYAAGTIGALANSIAVWGFGALGITASLGVKIAPKLTPMFLYPRLVWGGIWGLLFLLPILRNKGFWRGLLLSLGPTLVMLLVVFPAEGAGQFGLAKGPLTPAFVVFFNAVWGWAAVVWLKIVGER